MGASSLALVAPEDMLLNLLSRRVPSATASLVSARSALTAAVVPSALLPASTRGSAAVVPVQAAAAMQLRHKLNARTHGVWWQPLLPALAPDLVPNTMGKGNRKKKMQQRRAQSVTDHARRREGQRRSKMFSKMKEEEHHDRVRAVYQDYARLLQETARTRPSGDNRTELDHTSSTASPPAEQS